ncbi:hypothetical protein LWT14_22570, partial [Enterobacter hormaechei]|nr:hypothetical protein [Enterobacter hormaechei]
GWLLSAIALLRGFGGFADSKENRMKHDTLKNTIATLEKLRDAHCSQLDAGALAELDDVLQQLRSHQDSPVKSGNRSDDIVFRALRIIDIVLRLVTNITDWMK